MGYGIDECGVVVRISTVATSVKIFDQLWGPPAVLRGVLEVISMGTAAEA